MSNHGYAVAIFLLLWVAFALFAGWVLELDLLKLLVVGVLSIAAALVTAHFLVAAIVVAKPDNDNQAMELVVDHMADAVLLLDKDGKVVRANRRALALWGKEAAGANISELMKQVTLIAEDGATAVRFEETPIASVLRGDGSAEVVVNMKSATAGQARSNVSNLFNLSARPITAEGELAYVLVFARELSIMLPQPHEADERNKQRDSLVSVIAHDVKNSLIGADRILSILLSETLGLLSSSQQEVLTLMKRTNEDTICMLKDVLLLHRYDRGLDVLQFEEMNVARLARRSIHDTAVFADVSQVSVVTVFPEQMRTCNIDPLAMSHVFNNLLHNAIKYSTEGSVVEVSAEEIGNNVQLRVKDSGRGMSDAEVEFLFHKPIRDRRALSGSGIGLYLCNEIVKAHHGSIECVSQENAGSTFVVTLPLHPSNRLSSSWSSGSLPVTTR